LNAIATDDAPDREGLSSQADDVADLEPERGDEFRLDQDAVADEEVVRIRPAVSEFQAAIKRESAVNRADLDEAHGPVLPAGPRHRLRLDDVGSGRLEAGSDCDLHGRALALRPGPRRLDHDIGSHEHARLPRQGEAYVLDDAPEHDDGRHAERDAQEEEQQPHPGRSRLAPRHAENEKTGGHAGVWRPSDTMRPSRSAIVWPASVARAGSWVTSTSVLAC
jgi:hypothetical protein